MTPLILFVLILVALAAAAYLFSIPCDEERRLGFRRLGFRRFNLVAFWREVLGASNKALERATSVTLAMPAAANAGVGPNANDPILVGVMAGVVQNSYTSPTGVVTGNCSIDFEGAYFLSVVAKSSLSPSTGKAINPGDPVYYDGGTKDNTTNVTYGGTIDANSGGTFFGNSLDALTSGTTGVVRVRLPGAKVS